MRDETKDKTLKQVYDNAQWSEKILANALITNSGLIEPQNLKRKQWQCIHPSVHINHGYHFTSHYNVYSKKGIYTVHPYWGDYSKWKYLFD